MSLAQIHLCSFILKEHYGGLAEKLVVHLLKKGFTPMRVLVSETGLEINKVKKVLAVLIQHGIVSFEMNKRGIVEYTACSDRVLLHTRFPRYVYSAKVLYGDEAELIVEELLHHGQLCMSDVVARVTDRLTKAALTEGSSESVSVYAVRDKFLNLAQTQFITRCPSLSTENEAKTAVPAFSSDDTDRLFDVPKADLSAIASRKRKRSSDDVEEAAQPSKKHKPDICGDESILWTINHARFCLYFRDQAIVSAIANKVDKRAGELVRTWLRWSETKSDPEAPSTNPVSYNELLQALPQDSSITRQSLDQYLRILTEDSTGFVHKIGDSGGGQYVINFQNAFTSLCRAHIESVVRERYGSKCLRIFRLLIEKRHLEQKQIEDMAMIPSREAKEMLYRMFGEHMVALTDVPKTPDHAPSRTIYLFSVDLNTVARMLLQKAFKVLNKLQCRREKETADHRRLLDKQQRMEAIVASLEASGADAQQKAEIEEMVTPTERAQLAKVKHMTSKLEQCELQLDETLLVLQLFLRYANMK